MDMEVNEVFIVAAKRTPIGGFLGSLSCLSATDLGSKAISAALEAGKVDPAVVDSVYMGNVLSADLGQSPARIAALNAGLPVSADVTTVNKVCAAGMKAVVLGAQQIQLGLDNVIVAGGMESMSNVPHYTQRRKINKLGHETITDGLLKDGLTDSFLNAHMGNLAEKTARKFALSREQQDAYALESYERAAKASAEGKFRGEIVEVLDSNGNVILDKDEDVFKIIPEKVSKLKPVFDPEGSITAANASNLNDGAAALILVSKEAIEKYKLTPLARIVAYADAAQEPEGFTTAPSLAIPLALKRAGLSIDDIDFFEVNEAYSAVALANQEILGLDPAKTNIYGGAVAMGHPLGASGARIICTLISVLIQEKGRYGVAGICNGGGGASAIVIENMNL